MKQYRCEYLVVGTGAGGSVAGALLAQSGRDVLFIEEGDMVAPDSMPRGIGQGMQKLYRNGGIVPMVGSPLIPFAEARCVGGGTVINGALLWRTPPWILEEWRTRTGYQETDLHRHFETVERDLGVITHDLDDGSNIDSLKLYNAAHALGWKVVMAPRAVTRKEHGGNCNLCPVGCVPNGKNSTLKNYLPRAMGRGARLLSRCRAIRIEHDHNTARRLIAALTVDGTEERISIAFDYLVMAAGAVQTPHVLVRSGITRTNDHRVQFHGNLKTVAIFNESIKAHRGTIFTVQVQEFAEEGVVMMATNHTPHFLAITLARHGSDAVKKGLAHYFESAIYTSMVRMKSKARVFSHLGEQPLLWYQFNQDDRGIIITSIERTAQVLFQAGAIALYLPLKNSPPVSSMNEVHALLADVSSKDFDIATVHVMASCPMGLAPRDSLVRPDGRLWNMDNVLISDASMLPSNIGESPQGTIMAFAHESMGRHIASR